MLMMIKYAKVNLRPTVVRSVKSSELAESELMMLSQGDACAGLVPVGSYLVAASWRRLPSTLESCSRPPGSPPFTERVARSLPGICPECWRRVRTLREWLLLSIPDAVLRDQRL